ncbi:hypothetical protein [Paraburkholderia domus]|uniref:hypothetical protein n=1 Tax=Paraburkholderia domus TaxID=2793075 RepID=UPI001B01F27D|nr:hypothetical protein [Paraburkholderia domus]CAE6835297.1 hypothetical protein R75483_06889 [Paraburkholderia domus]
MAVTTSASRISYTGDGASVIFPFPYLFQNNADIEVWVNNVQMTSGFTTTGASNASLPTVGGQVAFATPPAIGATITLLRNPSTLQKTVIAPNDPFPAKTVETMVDAAMLANQRTLDILALQPDQNQLPVSLSLPFQESNLSGTIPVAAQRKNSVLGFDQNGLPISLPLPAAIGAGALTSEGPFVANVNFTPNVTTTLTLSQSYGAPANVDVHFDTEYQGTDQYAIVGNQIIFTSAIPQGVNKVYIVGGTTMSLMVPAASSVGVPMLAADTLSFFAQIGQLASSAGAALVGFVQSVTGAVVRTVQDKLTDGVSMFDFMTTAQIADWRAGTALVDQSAPLAAAAAWLGTAGVFKRKLTFPAGVCAAAAFPNFAISGAMIVNDGEVHLRYTGTGNAITLDAGLGNNVWGMTFGQGKGFIIEAPSTALDGAYIRNLYRCKVVARCWGAGVASAGFQVLGCVTSDFDLVTTNTERTGGWYSGTPPLTGVSIDQSAPGAQTAYCTFKCAIDSTQIGIYVASTLGNTFLGGYSEYNTIYGMQLTTAALNNKFYGMDFEQNTSMDVNCAGSYNEFAIDTGSGGATGGFRFVAGSVGNRLIGGEHDQVAIDAGTGNYIGGIIFGRGLSGNLQITDSGTKSAFGKCWQAQQQRWYFGPSYVNNISVGASPFTYTNNTGMDQKAFVSGGTVGNLSYFRGATLCGSLATNSSVMLSPGDSLSITYSSIPTLNVASIS